MRRAAKQSGTQFSLLNLQRWSLKNPTMWEKDWADSTFSLTRWQSSEWNISICAFPLRLTLHTGPANDQGHMSLSRYIAILIFWASLHSELTMTLDLSLILWSENFVLYAGKWAQDIILSKLFWHAGTNIILNSIINITRLRACRVYDFQAGRYIANGDKRPITRLATWRAPVTAWANIFAPLPSKLTLPSVLLLWYFIWPPLCTVR